MSEAAGPIETVWHVEATYAPDGAEARIPFRAEHIARLQRLRADGIVIEAGAFADVSATVMIVRADSEAEAMAIARDDAYMRNGVWVEVRVRPFGRVRDGEISPELPDLKGPARP
ncbi:MAG: YciI family protein [Chloroflexota bacterium]